MHIGQVYDVVLSKLEKKGGRLVDECEVEKSEDRAWIAISFSVLEKHSEDSIDKRIAEAEQMFVFRACLGSLNDFEIVLRRADEDVIVVLLTQVAA